MHIGGEPGAENEGDSSCVASDSEAVLFLPPKEKKGIAGGGCANI
jgi:hypothetical protein